VTAKAAANGETIAQVMRRALEAYDGRTDEPPPIDPCDVTGQVVTYRLTDRGVEVAVLLDDEGLKRLRFSIEDGWRL
jgi:hypothetical protein